MGIFTRLRDIINSNINAMLDRAEDPEKMLRLMLQEMDDTLVEIKAQCAAAMAQSKTLSRKVAEANDRVDDWGAKAKIAVVKGRDDLAREALVEKRRYQDHVNTLEAQKADSEDMVDKYQADIVELESKIASVREQQKAILQRHTHARSRKKAQETIRKVDTTDVFTRFEAFERRVDRMEAEADLVNYGHRPSLDDELAGLGVDEDIEAELNAIRDQVKGATTPRRDGN